MSTVSDYLKSISRRYPDTREVREQIEELRDTLHLKTEELQAQGKSYDEAAREAINSVGDITQLFGEVSGNIRTVYTNRLSRNNAFLCSLLILAELAVCWIVIISTTKEVMRPLLLLPFVFAVGGILLGVGVWAAFSFITWKREPLKTQVVDYPFRRLMRTAVISWLGLSFILLVINLGMGNYIRFDFVIVWFQWPMIGIANWPLNIWLYHRQLTGGRYDAQSSPV